MRMFISEMRQVLEWLRQIVSAQMHCSRNLATILGSKRKAHPLTCTRKVDQRSVVRVSEIVGASRRKSCSSHIALENCAKSVKARRRTKVSVIAWSVGHNAVGRAYLLAEALQTDYEVEIIAARFPRFGDDVWAPLRTCSRVTIKTYPGVRFPLFFHHLRYVARQVDGDVLYVSKPRLPSLELAILAKLERHRPIILDVDDYEPSFFPKDGPLTLDEVRKQRQDEAFTCPYGELWTRYCESLVPHFDGLSVSNAQLQKKYGGLLVPHMRDEALFNPDIYPRERIRTELGFTDRDRVILFAGTPRVHKGLPRLIQALRDLKDSRYKLLLVGSPLDKNTLRLLGKCSPCSVRTMDYVPYVDLPGYLCASDLICLLQDERSTISKFQMPAKFTDGLSMDSSDAGQQCASP